MEQKQSFYIFESDEDMVRPIFKNYNDALIHLLKIYNEAYVEKEAEELLNTDEMTPIIRSKFLRFVRAIKYDLNTALSQGYIEEMGYITNGEIVD